MIERLLPQAASAHAASVDAVLASIHVHMAAIFLVWLVVFAWALVRFRSGTQPEPRAQGAGRRWPLIAIAAIVAGDVLILVAQALPVWNARLAPPPPGADPLEIHIAAEQFAWNIHYPGPDGVMGRVSNDLISASNPLGIDRDDPAAKDDIGLQNVLTLPVGRTIVVALTSRDVVHSFTLPEMRVKQDAVPGQTARVWFTPTELGSWDIACSQLCGLGHYRMRGDVRVLSATDWERWQADEEARLR